MDLIERYVDAVERLPPVRQTDDLQGELHHLLMSRVEQRENALRRPLHAREAEALLVEFANRLAEEGGAVLARLTDERRALAADLLEGVS